MLIKNTGSSRTGCGGRAVRVARRWIRLGFVVAVLGVASPHLALAGQLRTGLDDYTVTTWNETDGLSDSMINAIRQDKDGYLWIGTDAGLLRFDGVRFEPFTGLGGVKLPTGPVTSLLSAEDRSLWVGVIGFPALARIRDGKLTLYGQDQGLPGATMSLLQDTSGAVLAGTSRGLFRLDGDRFRQELAEPALMDAAGVPLPVLAMYEARNGAMWMATRGGVVMRPPGATHFEVVDRMFLTSNYWQGFAEDDNGTIWINDFRQGFRRASEQASEKAPRLGWGVKLLSDRRGNLWVATRGQGLWRLPPGTREPHARHVMTTAGGLASDAIQSVLEDREGNIWVGTHGGLHRLTPHKVTPLINLPIARALAITPDGSTWVGTTTGLTRISRSGRTHYGEEQGLPGAVVLAMHAEEDGTIWVATERGLARFKDGHFTPLLVQSQVQRIFSITTLGNDIWLRDVNSRLIHATKDGRILGTDRIPERFHNATIVVGSDRRQRLWIGSTDGLVGVLERDGTFHTHQLEIGMISVLHEDESGTMWLGGLRGLGRISNGKITHVTDRNGFTLKVRSIVEDRQGVLWIGSGTGISRLEKSEVDKAAASADYQVRYRLFNTADGAAGVPITEGSRTAVRGTDGRLFIATSGGVTMVDPANLGDPRPVAPVKIETVVADATAFSPTSGLQLPARTSHLQFAFTALTLTDSVRTRFRYRLDGYDNNWVDAGTARQVSYTNLPPGHYRLRVKAGNGEGVWSKPGASLDFNIEPMFYQTRWFLFACVLALGSAIYGAWWLKVRRVRSQFALVLSERIRMSRAIHDTLLQGLAGLALQLDDLSHGMSAREGQTTGVLDKVLRMRRRVEDYIREARQSIWDLRSPTLEGRPFPEALREAGQRAIADRPVSLDVSVIGTPRPCSPAVQQQLLLICQEALANAVRHGHPSHVNVALEYTGNRVSVCVSDDGCGFDPETVTGKDGHYGVISMRERAAQVRGRLTIASTPGEGTRVLTVVPQM